MHVFISLDVKITKNIKFAPPAYDEKLYCVLKNIRMHSCTV
jgi:hypothetical protein